MKSRITKTVALAALMAGAAGVANATEGWYGRGDIGWSWDGEIDVGDDYANYEFGSSTLEHDWSEHLGLGYAFQNGFRLEGELGHRFNQIEPTDTIDAGGDVHAWSAMANLFYDFNRGGAIEPYIGVGVGGARLNYNVNDHSTLNYSEGEDTVLAYQGMVGFAVGLGEQWDLDIGYRYFVADGAEGDATDTFIGSSTVVTPYTTDADYEHQALTVGLRYQFAAPAPPPPPPRRRTLLRRRRRRQLLQRARRRNSSCTSSGIVRTSTKRRSKPSMQRSTVRVSATSAARSSSVTPTRRVRRPTTKVCRSVALRSSATPSWRVAWPPARSKPKHAAKAISPVRRATVCVSL